MNWNFNENIIIYRSEGKPTILLDIDHKVCLFWIKKNKGFGYAFKNHGFPTTALDQRVCKTSENPEK